MNRFLLDLQEASKRNVKLASNDPMDLSGSYGSLSFARIMGSIGETISRDTALEDDDVAMEILERIDHTPEAETAGRGGGSTCQLIAPLAQP